MRLRAEIASETHRDKWYKVAADTDEGFAWCECGGWRFQKGIPPRERSCKHTRPFMKILDRAQERGEFVVPSNVRNVEVPEGFFARAVPYARVMRVNRSEVKEVPLSRFSVLDMGDSTVEVVGPAVVGRKVDV